MPLTVADSHFSVFNAVLLPLIVVLVSTIHSSLLMLVVVVYVVVVVVDIRFFSRVVSLRPHFIFESGSCLFLLFALLGIFERVPLSDGPAW